MACQADTSVLEVVTSATYQLGRHLYFQYSLYLKPGQNAEKYFVVLDCSSSAAAAR